MLEAGALFSEVCINSAKAAWNPNLMPGRHLPGEGVGLSEKEEGSLCRGPWGRGMSPGAERRLASKARGKGARGLETPAGRPRSVHWARLTL